MSFRSLFVVLRGEIRTPHGLLIQSLARLCEATTPTSRALFISKAHRPRSFVFATFENPGQLNVSEHRPRQEFVTQGHLEKAIQVRGRIPPESLIQLVSFLRSSRLNAEFYTIYECSSLFIYPPVARFLENHQHPHNSTP
jgi:hypothetical protein